MTLGAGLPSLDVNSLVKSLSGGSFFNSLQDRTRDIISNPGNPEHHLDDRIDLSDQAREVIRALESGFAGQRQQDVQFTRERLQAVQEQIEFAAALLNVASDSQQGVIVDLINDIIGGLGSVGGDIGALLEESFSSLFNGASRGSGDLSVSYAESLNVEFNFTRITERTETIEISQGEDGSLTVRQAIETTEIVVAQLSIEREQTLIVRQGDNSGPGRSGEARGQDVSDIRHLINEFRDTLRQFSNLLEAARERFGGPSTDFPPPLIDVLRELTSINGGAENDTDPVLLNLAA